MIEPSAHRSQILITDDEKEIRDVLVEYLSPYYECQAASSAEQALSLLDERKFDLVISDITMGGMTGLQLIPLVGARSPHTLVILISGAQVMENAIEALRVGAFDYLMKPFDLRQVGAVVRRALIHHKLLEDKRRYENYLEELVEQRTAQLDRALDSLQEAYRATLKSLVASLETRDAETHGHSERVVNYSLCLGRELGLDGEQMRELEFGSLLHDIGKLGVPDAVLRKPSSLDADEWACMREHPALGQQILRGIDFLNGSLAVVGQHHEKWDGTGYPNGLRSENIDLKARIFAVADAYDAITSDRVYRAGRPFAAALDELIKYSGRQFDPQVVAAFQRVPQTEWERLSQQTSLTWQQASSLRSFDAAASITMRRQAMPLGR
ncbi:MAG: response regulator [Pyrinomonadaceae bacterium MAG19_C2-C3]|nr:response regulator [Pyrinomonadaceae bacterium MAG19_C2-C3]